MTFERENIRRMAGYAYGEQPSDADVVKLNTNENAYPPSPKVREALMHFDVETLRRYPPATADPLRRQIAGRFGLDMAQVVVTNGGDEGLRLAVTTFLDQGATFGMATPSYSLYPVLAEVQGCPVVEIPLQRNWSLPPDFAARLNAAETKLACLVNPHAPSGTLVDADTIAALAGELNGVLLVDEAYVDFVSPAANHDLTPLLRTHDNLLLLRTFSKGYSLAGLRVGYLLGSTALIEPILNKTRDSFNVDAIAQTLAAAAFSDQPYAAACWQRTREERHRLAQRLRDLGFAVPGSQTNFLLAQAPPSICARDLQRTLRQRNLLVRHFNAPRLADSLRITVGSRRENDALLALLDELLETRTRPAGRT